MALELLYIGIWFIATLIIATIAALLGKRYGLVFPAVMFVGAIVIANVVAQKIIVIGPFTSSAGLVVFSITFLLTDTISEFWGRKVANRVVWSGFMAYVMLVFVTWVSVQLTPASFWGGQEAFALIFGSAPRIALASVLAYIAGQTHDVWAFHFWKKKTRGKHLWFRNNASTWVSQTIDTLIFVTIAFYGIFPIYTLILSTIFLKIVIGAVDTPFLYFIRWYYEKTGKPWKQKSDHMGVVPGV